jgi:BASS family bile acid:Na+ symporter
MPSCHPERQRRIPSGNVREVTAGQALGQKNTVFAIWMGYTFMTAETAIVGGLYSIWHNLYNSHQLRRANRTADSV